MKWIEGNSLRNKCTQPRADINNLLRTARTDSIKTGVETKQTNCVSLISIYTLVNNQFIQPNAIGLLPTVYFVLKHGKRSYAFARKLLQKKMSLYISLVNRCTGFDFLVYSWRKIQTL